MNEVVFKALKQKDFIVKSFVLKVATELNLSLSDTILLIYLSNQEVPTLDVENIVLTTYLKEEQVLESFQKLVSLIISGSNSLHHLSIIDTSIELIGLPNSSSIKL